MTTTNTNHMPTTPPIGVDDTGAATSGSLGALKIGPAGTDPLHGPDHTEGSPMLHGDGTLLDAMIASLGFSEADWLRILNAHCGLPSERRAWFGETAEFQAHVIHANVYDDDPCPASRDLSRRIASLPSGFDLAVLEVIERFWSDDASHGTFVEKTAAIGVRICQTAHERMAAGAARRKLAQAAEESSRTS